MGNEREGGGPPIGSGTGGNTAGTGGPDLAPIDSGVGAGAAGTGGQDSKQLAQREEERHGGTGRREERNSSEKGGSGEGDERRTDMTGASPKVAEAIEGGQNASAPRITGGKLSSEQTGTTSGGPVDAGSPGGMGGTGAGAAASDNRPPGGISPMQGPKGGDEGSPMQGPTGGDEGAG